ncbi:hypothetical protein M0804_000677 [Polistes exclamans]|nr:hypothetical protein M0804_000677 [Polistes exclamans]
MDPKQAEVRLVLYPNKDAKNSAQRNSTWLGISRGRSRTIQYKPDPKSFNNTLTSHCFDLPTKIIDENVQMNLNRHN